MQLHPLLILLVRDSIQPFPLHTLFVRINLIVLPLNEIAMKRSKSFSILYGVSSVFFVIHLCLSNSTLFSRALSLFNEKSSSLFPSLSLCPSSSPYFFAFIVGMGRVRIRSAINVQFPLKKEPNHNLSWCSRNFVNGSFAFPFRSFYYIQRTVSSISNKRLPFTTVFHTLNTSFFVARVLNGVEEIDTGRVSERQREKG